MSSFRYVLVLIWLLSLYTIGLYFFTRGFLLKRVVLNDKNHCNTTENDLPPQTNECWLPARFSRAVFVIIDGLRYDFARWNESVTNPSPYQNKLLTIHETITRQPKHSKLYKFIADAPTTTLQRIKALTTGSLPTFIDMGSNFDSSEITEDNIIDQLVTAGKRIVFMGDDTWTGLFPDRFQYLYPFPSFNTKDLDTVDNGILQRLIPTMKSDEWDVIVAHFLGVDHCGHTYGPNHPLMGQKLNQLDLILKSVVSNLREDTILFVLGDHGMSSSGDHGGDSRDEIMSALFVYSPKTLHKSENTVDETVLQIDLVPTVSLLLGTPIPFGNLGSVITDLIDEPVAPTASYVNALQVNKYLEKYVAVADDFSSSDWTTVESSFAKINKSDEKWLQQSCHDFLRLALSMCRKVWATFDAGTMWFGILFTVLSILMCGYVSVTTLPTYTTLFCSISSLVNMSFLLFAILNHSSESDFFLLTLIFVSAFIPCMIFFYLTWTSVNLCMPSVDTSVAWLTCLVLSVGVLSNSYLVNEASCLSFFLQILFLIGAIFPRRIVMNIKSNWDTLTTHQTLRVTLCVLLSFILRLSMFFQRCRSEQFWCVDDHLASELDSGRQIRLLTSLGCVSFLVYTFLQWLRHCGNLAPYTIKTTIIKYCSVCAGACICFSWSLSYLPAKLRISIPSWQYVWVPRAALACLVFILLTFIINPLLIHISSSNTVAPTRSSTTVPQLFQHLKLNWRQYFSTNISSHIPIVFGLASIYSSGSVVCLFAVSLLCTLFLGPTFAPAIFLLVTCLFLTLFLLSTKKTEIIDKPEDAVRVPWIDVIIWTFLSSYYFFTTGHQASISTIHWSAAFVGASGEMTGHVLPAVRVLIDTFASQIIFSLGVHLLVIWPFTCHLLFPSVGFTADFAQQGEVFLYNKQHLFIQSTFQVTTKYFCLQGLKLFGTMLAASIHRRHLMVWALFAPRYIFEAVASIICFLCTLVAFLILLRIHVALRQWLAALEKKCDVR